MKLIIAGTRDLEITMPQLDTAINKFIQKNFISEVVSGNSGNVDLLGEQWAKLNNIPVKLFPADWPRYGNAAGPIRNGEMAKYADCALILTVDGRSKGSRDMLKQIQRADKPHLMIYLDEDS